MFGSAGLNTGLNTSSTFGNVATPASINPMKDFEVASPPDDTVSAMEFSPATISQNYLVAGSWDNSVCTLQTKIPIECSLFLIFYNLGSLLGGRTNWKNCAETNEDYDGTSFRCLLGRCKY